METTRFEKFKNLAATTVAEIKDEIASLYEIKDLIDELNIMAVLFQDQKKVFKTLDNLVWTIDADQNLHSDLDTSEELEQENIDLSDIG